MKKKHREYKVGGKPQGLIPSLILLAVFGGVSIWLRISNHGAFIFAAIFTVLILVLIACSIYRAIFVKVLIDENGFYHQTRPGNGKYYEYNEIIKAWESSGKSLNGTQSYYCNYKTAGGQVIKFPFFASESDGINYLLNCVNNEEKRKTEKIHTSHEEWNYKIDGKNNGITAIIISLVLSAIFVVLTIDQLQPQPNKLLIIALSFGSMAIISLYLLIRLLIRYFCFKVYIGSTGFYFQSTPFNGKYYKYSNIKSCREELKIRRHRAAGRRSSSPQYYYFFIFTDKNGKTTKFQFEKPLCEHEINFLNEKIENPNL